MFCPKCDSQNAVDAYRCSNGNSGFRLESRPENRPTRYLGAAGTETQELKIVREFHCLCCESFNAMQARISSTGNGISRLLNFQCVDYLVVTCRFCGTSILKDAKALNPRRSISFYIDFFWGTIRFIVILLSIVFLLNALWSIEENVSKPRCRLFFESKWMNDCRHLVVFSVSLQESKKL